MCCVVQHVAGCRSYILYFSQVLEIPLEIKIRGSNCGAR